MGSQLHEALRILCSNTDWNYAVFWKLQHRDPMMLTWKDAYYGNHVSNLCDVRNSHDTFGIVGQVAVTGKHLWISSPDNNLAGSCSSFEYCEGWETQFSSGIRTIAVVGLVPHGVLQLGSLSKIAEDLKQVKHIRDIFVEALGPAFIDQNTNTDWEKEKSETVSEAVLANVCHSGSTYKFSEQSDRAKELVKINKKRGRNGQRDRQLIQDRIKELRDLVPNGSKRQNNRNQHRMEIKKKTGILSAMAVDNLEGEFIVGALKKDGALNASQGGASRYFFIDCVFEFRGCNAVFDAYI